MNDDSAVRDDVPTPMHHHDDTENELLTEPQVFSPANVDHRHHDMHQDHHHEQHHQHTNGEHNILTTPGEEVTDHSTPLKLEGTHQHHPERESPPGVNASQSLDTDDGRRIEAEQQIHPHYHENQNDHRHDGNDEYQLSLRHEGRQSESPQRREASPPNLGHDSSMNKNNAHHHPDRNDKENQMDNVSAGDDDDGEQQWWDGTAEKEVDPEIIAQNEFIERTEPQSDLEHAMKALLARKDSHIERLTNEIQKLKKFISKRKQTYKRKRKDEGAPTRALSGYNIFIKERFAQLAKENEEALKSTNTDAELKRVPPANLVAKTGNEWKALPPEEKARYDEIAKADRKRYEEQMTQYQPPDKQSNRKRNKTGYNMFFSAHVLRMKQTESGVPSERGSVAREVGTAWKRLNAEEKQYYEREADKHNGMHPVKEGDDEEDDEEEVKRLHVEAHHYSYSQPALTHPTPGPEMHPAYGAMPPHMHPGMAAQAHDPRAAHHGYYPPHMYGHQPPPAAYGHYDYSQHHQRHQQARAQGYSQAYPPRHPYEGGM